jgi:hypothetical protein
MGDMTQEYIIKSIQTFPFQKGYVAIFLSPRDKIDMGSEQPCPFKIQGFGTHQPPKELIQMLTSEIGSMLPKQKQHDDFRDIIIIVTETDFYGLGWAYGDVISGDFKKILDGKSINPFDKEEKIK